MTPFWQAIMRTRVRAVALLCGCFLVLMSLYVFWESLTAKELRPVNTPMPVDLAPEEEGGKRLADVALTYTEISPFQSDYLSARLLREAVVSGNMEASPPTAPAPTGQVAVVAVTSTPVRLVYRGMIRRPDGTVVAMIEDEDEGLLTNLKQGEAIRGFTIGGIGRDTLQLVGEQGGETVLTAGVPAGLR